jgi:Carboxypeptidase regulatory-like domain/TonB dependent receptor
LLNELTHRTKSGLRSVLTFALLLAFVLCSMPSAFAQTITGNIQGTVTASQANTKLAGVTVTAVAPSGRYTATTDSNGFFSINGVTPDTYNVTFTRTGYETYTVSGVTVVQGQVANVSSALNQSLQRIGRTQARSTTGAYQPSQTTDQYNVGTQQITTALGKQGGANESNLLASIPGASFDSSGYPVLRGGRETEEGFQFEGIDYTDAFTHQFVNSLVLNGASNFQVTPGAGDASQGNVGTGSINIVAKRGTHPAFGQFEGDVRAGRYEHELRGEYGWASPNGRYSDYASTLFDRNAYNYGGNGAGPLLLGAYFTGRTLDTLNEVTNNFVYKFGRDNNQSLQFFYDNSEFDLKFGLGTNPGTLPFKDNDPQFLLTARGALGFSTAFEQALMPFTYGQRSLTDRIGLLGDGRKAINGNQPNETSKLQYSNSLNATTFITAKYYRVNAVALFDDPYNGNNTFFGDYSSLQGGQRTGFSLDGTKQLGSKNLLGFGGKYEYLSPVFSQPSSTNALLAFGGFGGTIDAADFIPAGSCPSIVTAGYGATCGYLISHGFVPRSPGPALFDLAGQAGCPAGNPTFTNVCALAPSVVPLPYSDETTSTPRQDFAFYLKDTFSPTDRLKIDLGVRMDGVNWRYPTCDIHWCLPTSFTTSGGVNTYQFNYDRDTRAPRVWQPRLAVSFQATRNDAFRASYGRSVQFAPIAAVDLTTGPYAYRAFQNVPSRDPITGTTAMFCGTSVNLGFNDAPCKNYADQLMWEIQNVVNGVPITPLKPTTFNNWDFSYSHLFPHQVSVKITPFYSKAFNEVASTAQPIIKNGVTVLNSAGLPQLGPSVNSNLGKNQITGVEFLLTKEAAYGLSGSLSMTYQNEFSNVVPTSPSEDFFPSIPPASLALGNLYRVGFLSPFVGALSLQERTRTGWRINPVVYYNHGYPIGSGLLTAATINGAYYNVPNTNITNSSQLGGAAGAPQYVDPRNPGTMFNPNIAATRGTPETASAGGVLSAARFTNTQITFEYTSPRNPHSTFGALVQNVFNQLYTEPGLNTRYQPIATGINGPYSGYTSSATNPAFYGVRNFTAINGNRAYLLAPSNQPRTVQFYYQLNL